MLAIRDLSTVRILPWAHKCGLVVSDLFLSSGERRPFDPRLILAREHAWCGRAGGPSEMAFVHRQHPSNFLALSSWAEPSEAERNIKWTRSVGTPFARSWFPAPHVNYLDDEADPYVRAAYGADYDQLVAFKDEYGPNTLFRIAHNTQRTVPA